MDRRTFLKNISICSAGAAMVLPHTKLLAQNSPATQPILVTSVNSDYEKLVRDTLNALGGIKKFVKPGDKVVVKPNIGWDRTPEQAANTHPVVVKTLVELVLSAEPSQVKVFDRTCNEDRRCYTRSGIKSILDEIPDSRLRCEYMDERKYVPVKIEKGKAVTEWEFYKEALDADVYINLPVAKHHGLSGLTLGLKNNMGILGGNRGKIHQNIDQKLADLATIIRPNLTVIDATRMLLRNGPQGGNIKDVKISNTLVASVDPVAVDAYVTTLFDMKPEDVGSTSAAYNMGLGEMNVGKIKIIKV